MDGIVNAGADIISGVDVGGVVNKVQGLLAGVTNQQLVSIIILICAVYFAINIAKKLIQVVSTVIGLIALVYLLAPNAYDQIATIIK